MTLLYEVRQLGRAYRKGEMKVSALQNLNFEVKAGEFLGISGPSGSGKSTLLNILGFTDAPSSGVVKFEGQGIDFANDRQLLDLRRARVGYVFQYFNLLPTLSALENVALSLTLNQAAPKVALGRAQAQLEVLGLGTRAGHYPHELSGGEMQRVAIARASVHKPMVILADEPTGNLDSQAGELVLELFRGLNAQKTTVIVASHSREVLGKCSRVITLRDGHLS